MFCIISTLFLLSFFLFSPIQVLRANSIQLNNKPSFWKDLKTLITRSPFPRINWIARTLKSELKEKDELSLLCHPESGNVIALIGTAHIAEESANLVREVIQKVRPSVVMIELDIQRFLQVLVDEPSVKEKKEKGNSLWSYCWKKLQSWIEYFSSEASKELKRRVELILKIQDSFDYGGEFRAAYDEGRKVGAKILLGDKIENFSFQQAREIVSFQPKRGTKAANEYYSEIENLNVTFSSSLMKVARAINRSMKDDFPNLYKELIETRDQYMADAMLGLKGSSEVIVAVVGAAHTFGIESILVNQGGYHLHGKD